MSKADTGKPSNDAGNSALGDAYDKVSERVAAAYAAARDKAGSATAGLDANPVAALLGGLALGAIAGALLPRLEKEKELLGPIGDRIGDAARAAFDAAKSAGGDALDEAGLSVDSIRGQVPKLIEQVVNAAGAAGTAAVGAARQNIVG